MTLTIQNIDGANYITHVDIAKTSLDFVEKQNPVEAASTPAATKCKLLIEHTGSIKRHLVRLQQSVEREDLGNEDVLPGKVLTVNFDRLADKDAFRQLANDYQWCEDYTMPILAALGEWGEHLAIETLRELNAGDSHEHITDRLRSSDKVKQEAA